MLQHPSLPLSSGQRQCSCLIYLIPLAGKAQQSQVSYVVRSYALLWLVKRNQARLPWRFGPLQPAIAVLKTSSWKGVPPSASTQPHQPFRPDGSATPLNISRGSSGDEPPEEVWGRFGVLISITARVLAPALPQAQNITYKACWLCNLQQVSKSVRILRAPTYNLLYFPSLPNMHPHTPFC